jgi:predicted amidohydrolase YtcJ
MDRRSWLRRLIAQRKRHPTADDLAAISKQHPIAIVHVSGHWSVGNSTLMSLLDISSPTVDPSGGSIVVRAGSLEPNGIF